MVARIASIEAVVCASPHEAAWLERNLLERSLPPWNRTPGGQEVPVLIHLDAGLRVIHDPAQARGRLFGPYLGGRRARLAGAALRRVYPLTAAEHALARAPLADPGEIAAVLTRQPDAVAAVRARLTGLRDAAAAGLAFERAGQLQEQLEALGWITQPQRVTGLEPRDLDVGGWVGGIGVRFEIRGGALSAWHQERCPAALSARPPAEWAPFADRNARLAATLSSHLS